MQPKIDINKFKELFYKKRLPCNEIAKQFNCTVAGIDSFRFRHKLPPRGWATGKSPKWKGGRIKNKYGYILIYSPGHPKSANGYVREHRLIMEKRINRLLKKNEHIHHINGNRADNRIENLIILTNSQHAKKHSFGIAIRPREQTRY